MGSSAGREDPGNAARQVVDLEALRELAWSGIPAELRPQCWQLLLGYLPPNRERRSARALPTLESERCAGW